MSESAMGVVAVHPEDGIYLGLAAGRALWSRVDDTGPVAAPAYADEATARIQVAAACDPDLCEFHPVPVGPGRRATPEALRLAGLGAHLGFISPTRYLVVHPGRGVYLGGCEGGVVSWWSREDGMADTDGAPTFGDPEEAMAWLGAPDPEPWLTGISLVPVRADLGRGRSSAAAMREAGLGDEELGEMAHAGWGNAPGRC